jgi:putative acyl-CoA dehydrogenase
MMNVLADLALDSEAALLLVMRLARAFDDGDRSLLRVLTPAAKFWICKRAIEFCGECMEILGGNGYVEDGPLAALYREAPVNSIWEGSGNVMCLDVLRALAKAGEALPASLESLLQSAAKNSRLRVMLDELNADLRLPPEQQQTRARRITQTLVLLVQSALMIEHAPEYVASTFIGSRCDAAHGRVYGALPAEHCKEIIGRAWPM